MSVMKKSIQSHPTHGNMKADEDPRLRIGQKFTHVATCTLVIAPTLRKWC
jgi:hypothetical protein